LVKRFDVVYNNRFIFASSLVATSCLLLFNTMTSVDEESNGTFLFDVNSVNLTPGDELSKDPLCPIDSISFRLRPLCSTDYNRGYINLLSQLTVTFPVTQEMFSDTFNIMKNAGIYYIIVVEDLTQKQIVASGSLILEKKFIHSCGQRGRIEDIVVNSKYRGKRFGKIIVQCLMSMARTLHCYKISLECNDSNVNWYNSMGFVREQGNSNFMQIKFDKY